MAKGETKITKKRLRSSYITSIVSISLVLFLLGLVGLLILNARMLSNHVREQISFSIILKEGLRDPDIDKLEKDLLVKPYVKKAQKITKEEAAEELKEALGEDFIEFLGYNPLLASIDVKLHAAYTNPDSLEFIEKEFQQYDEFVKEVFYQKSLVHLVNENVKKISLIILVISSVLFFIAFTLINNTIRLSVYSKRFLINTMQLVGATRNFIRKPFVFKSAIHGIYAAIIGNALLFLFIYFVEEQIEEFVGFENYVILLILFLGVILLGIFINSLATYFAVNKYLKLKVDNLYA